MRDALPVGTGPGVGVVGYIVNGGLNGYFSRRLGLLGQRRNIRDAVVEHGERLSLWWLFEDYRKLDVHCDQAPQ